MDQEIRHQILIGLVCNLLIVDCGLHEGWATITLPKFGNEDPLELTSNQQVLLINLLYVGVGLGSLAPVFLMDRYGRKWTLLAAAVPKIFSWIAIGLANSHMTLYAARLLAGVGCGISYSVMPMYIGEISTKRTRGPLGTLQTVLINIGVLLVYSVGLHVERFTMAMMSLVVPVLFIVTFIWLPESSVYLTRKNRLVSAEKTLKWSLGKENVEEEFEEIKRIVATEDVVKKIGFCKSLIIGMKSPANQRAAGIMLIVANAMSLTGAAPILSYQSFIFEEAKFEIGANAGIISTGCAIVLAGMACVAMVKRFGKRNILLYGTPIAILSLATTATYFTLTSYQVNLDHVNWIPMVFVVIYIVVFGLSFNPMPLAYLGELFSFEIKAAAGICTSLYYALSTIGIIKLYQVLHDSYGTHAPFWLFTVITLILWIFIYLYVMETEGKTLEEIQNDLYRVATEKKRKSVVGINPLNKIHLESTSINSTKV